MPKALPAALAGIAKRRPGSTTVTAARGPANSRSARAASIPAIPAPAIDDMGRRG